MKEYNVGTELAELLIKHVDSKEDYRRILELIQKGIHSAYIIIRSDVENHMLNLEEEIHRGYNIADWITFYEARRNKK